MSKKRNSVQGSWLGNYYYENNSQPFSFEAVFVESEGQIEGSILDDGSLGEALVSGSFCDPNLNFTKRYHNSTLDPVQYLGTLSGDGNRISGSWQIRSLAKGAWTAWRQDEEEIPEFKDELEARDMQEDAHSKVMALPLTQKQK